MIREHGDEVLAEAKSRANAFWDKGDDDGMAVWVRIAQAIEELQKTSPGATDRTH